MRARRGHGTERLILAAADGRRVLLLEMDRRLSLLQAQEMHGALWRQTQPAEPAI